MTCLEHDVDLDQFGGNVRHVGEVRYVKHQIPAGMRQLNQQRKQ